MIYITFILTIPFLSSIIAYFFEWIEREVSFVSTITSTYISFVLYYKYRNLSTLSLYYFVFDPEVLLFLFIFNLVFTFLIILSFKLMRKHPYSNRFYFNVLLMLVFLNFLYLSNIKLLSIFVPLLITITIFLSGWEGKGKFLIKETIAWLFLFLTLFLKQNEFITVMVFVYVFVTFLPVSKKLRNKTPIIYGFIRFAQLFSVIFWIVFFEIDFHSLYYVILILLSVVYFLYLFKDSNIWKIFEMNYLLISLNILFFLVHHKIFERTIFGLIIWLLSVLIIFVSLYYKYYSDGNKILVDVIKAMPIFFFLIFLQFSYFLPLEGSIVINNLGFSVLLFLLQLSLVVVSLFTLFSFVKTDKQIKIESATPFLLKVMPGIIMLTVISNGINIIWGRIKWEGLIPPAILLFFLFIYFVLKRTFNARLLSTKRKE